MHPWMPRASWASRRWLAPKLGIWSLPTPPGSRPWQLRGPRMHSSTKAPCTSCELWTTS